jgi:hypothetical protein
MIVPISSRANKIEEEQRKGASDLRTMSVRVYGNRQMTSRTRHCIGVRPVSLLNATPNELWLA